MNIVRRNGDGITEPDAEPAQSEKTNVVID
jgi:hypothetical protein